MEYDSCSRDPIGYKDGYNSYGAYFLIDGTDPSGLELFVEGNQGQRNALLTLLNQFCPEAGGFSQASGRIQPISADFCKDKWRCRGHRTWEQLPGSYSHGNHPISCGCLCDAINGWYYFRLRPREINPLVGPSIPLPGGGSQQTGFPQFGAIVTIGRPGQQYTGSGEPVATSISLLGHEFVVTRCEATMNKMVQMHMAGLMVLLSLRMKFEMNMRFRENATEKIISQTNSTVNNSELDHRSARLRLSVRCLMSIVTLFGISFGVLRTELWLDERDRTAAKLEYEKQKNKVRSELLSFSQPHWNGEYLSGDRNQRVLLLSITHHAGWVAQSDGLSTRCNQGTLKFENGVIELSAKYEDPWIPKRLSVVRLDDRVYLIPPSKLDAFQVAIDVGIEPRNSEFGEFLLKLGDHRKPVHKEPGDEVTVNPMRE